MKKPRKKSFNWQWIEKQSSSNAEARCLVKLAREWGNKPRWNAKFWLIADWLDELGVYQNHKSQLLDLQLIWYGRRDAQLKASNFELDEIKIGG